MSVITFDSSLRVSRMRWERKSQDVEFRGPFGAQSMNTSQPLWRVGITFDLLSETESGPYKSLLMRLEGAKNNLAIWDFGRPQPLGTLRGFPTLGAALAVGATAMTVSGVAGSTLKQGDYLGFGADFLRQVVMVTADATLTGGTAVVSFSPPARSAQSSGSALVWDKPTALFRQQISTVGWDYERTTVSGGALDLLEDWRP